MALPRFSIMDGQCGRRHHHLSADSWVCEPQTIISLYFNSSPEGPHHTSTFGIFTWSTILLCRIAKVWMTASGGHIHELLQINVKKFNTQKKMNTRYVRTQGVRLVDGCRYSYNYVEICMDFWNTTCQSTTAVQFVYKCTLFVLLQPSGILGEPHPAQTLVCHCVHGQVGPLLDLVHRHSRLLCNWPYFFAKFQVNPWKRSPRRERFTGDLLFTANVHVCMYF